MKKVKVRILDRSTSEMTVIAPHETAAVGVFLSYQLQYVTAPIQSGDVVYVQVKMPLRSWKTLQATFHPSADGTANILLHKIDAKAAREALAEVRKDLN